MIIGHYEPGLSVVLWRKKVEVISDKGREVYTFETLEAALKKYNQVVRDIWESNNDSISIPRS